MCVGVFVRKAKVEGNRLFHVPIRGSIIINMITGNMGDREKFMEFGNDLFHGIILAHLPKNNDKNIINKQNNLISSINPHNSLCLPSEL